jgi:hypothetical protein
MRHVHRYRHYYSIYAEWLGCICRRFPAMAGNVPFLMKDRNRHHYSVHAGWLGCVCGRISRNDRQRSFPDEGCGSFCCISLFAEAGGSKSIPLCQTQLM